MWQKHTTATGTVWINKKGLQDKAVRAKLGQLQVSERRKGPLLCVAYKDGKKTPVLLSTVAKAGFTTVQRQQKRDKELPCIVADYNKVMGGVDLKDTELYAYLGGKKNVEMDCKDCFVLLWYSLSQQLHSIYIKKHISYTHSVKVPVHDQYY